MRSSRPFDLPSLGLVLAGLAPVLTGLAASAALAVDYVRAAPVFCAEGGGCDALRHSAFASLFGVPTPFFGAAGFLAIGVLTLAGGTQPAHAPAARFLDRLRLVLAAVAALAGGTLFAAQIVLGHFCPYCLAADASGVLALVVGLIGARAPTCRALPALPPRDSAPGLPNARAMPMLPWVVPLLGGVAMLAAGLVPLAIGMRRPVVALPEAIRREMAHVAPGQVPIVDFVDFECPFCRMTDAALEPLVAAHRDRIHLVRRQVPLRIHPHARDAARAACCGEALGQGDAMASALFRIDVNELTPEGCEQVAERLGLSLSAYRACVADPKTDERIDADRQEFKDAGGYALPTIWIGAEPVVGAQPAPSLAAAIDRALAKAGS